MRFGSAIEVMQHAIRLARRGVGCVEPNPPVGAVVVRETAGGFERLGEGWHEAFGGPHAEVHALRAAGESARGATLFVTLEPCCHKGKTPPCSRAVLDAGIARVVVGRRDPAPHVDGGGIRELREAGVVVDVGVEAEDAAALVAPFVMLEKCGRPWVHAKWAMTLDGRIATHTGHSRWISNERSRARVHELRSRMDAVLVGAGTARTDDPELTARLPDGTPPARIATRVVLDGQASLATDSQLVRTIDLAPLIVFTTDAAPAERVSALESAGVDVVVVPGTDGVPSRPNVADVLADLGRRRFTNVLVEGGGRLLGSFLDADLIDEVHVFTAPKLVGAGAPPIDGRGFDEIPQQPSLVRTTFELLEGDVYVNGFVRREGDQTES